MRKIILSAIAVAATTQVQSAYALNFDFSFSEGPNATVTGEIFGLASSGQSAATDVVITSASYGLGSASLPFDMFAGSHRILANTFSVKSGYITNANLLVLTSNTNQLCPTLELNHQGVNSFYGTDSIANRGGFQGATYTLHSSNPAPEPASIALLGAGLAGIAGFRRRKAA